MVAGTPQSPHSTQRVTISRPVFRGHRCNILRNFGCIGPLSSSVVGRGWGEEACWRVRLVLVSEGESVELSTFDLK